MNLSDVTEVEELLYSEFTDHAQLVTRKLLFVILQMYALQNSEILFFTYLLLGHWCQSSGSAMIQQPGAESIKDISTPGLNLN